MLNRRCDRILRITRLIASACVVVALALPASASAAVPASGKWQGTHHGAPLTFKVLPGGHRLKNFTIQVEEVYCFNVVTGGGQVQFVTFKIPSAKIAPDGTISGTFKTHASDGSVSGTLKIDGKFTSAHKAHGKAHYSVTPCYGTESWSATFGKGGRGHKRHPKSIKGAKYSGTTDQGHPLSIKVAANGRKLKSFKISKIDEKCGDGGTDSINFTLGLSDHVRVDRKGRFSWAHKGRDAIAVTGRLTGSRATGEIDVKSKVASTTCVAITKFNLPRA